MIEQIFKLTRNDDNAVEKLIMDDNIHYIHMTFQNGNGLPEHFSNATLYMTVLRGVLSLGLDDQSPKDHAADTVLKIPQGIKMNVRNTHDAVLELIVVKAPAPGK
ncbi:MAG: hypothetical protein PWQ12_1756 [Clostridiales bacterium]|jgi:quercetin dioxygenase-like cupin family protein|nr:hypothetical protein [Clostridiales bacterium]